MGKKAPQAPDPYKLADAQLGVNVGTAEKSAALSAVDQNTPWGSSTYERDPVTGAPTAQNVTLSPGEQQYYESQLGLRNQTSSQLNDIAGGDLSGDAVQQALFDRKMGLLQPQFDRQQNELNLMLMERGIPLSSEIDQNQRGDFARWRNEATNAAANDAILAGGNEQSRLFSLLTGQPPLGPTPQMQQNPAWGINSPDLMGAVMNNYNQELDQYNQRRSNFWSGVTGLGSALIGLSDRRVKTDIRRVGSTDSGLSIYTFRYKGGQRVEMGVMADEVEKLFPEAVYEIEGLKHVDYSLVA